MMLKFDVGKREQNRVTQKMKILNTFLEAMSTQSLSELNIEEVCKSIGISKVTFFNYFKSKEEVVEYFTQMWQFEVSYEVDKRGLKGKDALSYLLDHVSSHPAANSIMLALNAFFIKNGSYIPTQISEYELYVYNEKAYLEGYRSVTLYQVVKKAVGELGDKVGDQNIMITNFVTGFYGVPIVCNIGLGQELKLMYRNYLDSIIPDSMLI